MVEIIIPTQLWNDAFRFLKIREKNKEPTGDMVGWQKDNFQYNDGRLLNHLINGGNYGIIGGYGNLILIDSDSPEITSIADTLPETFTVKTGSPEEWKKHYFFITDVLMKPIRLSKEKIGDLGDVRGMGQYVVAPNCIHPKGGIYQVIKDIPITHITEKEIRDAFKDYIDKNDSTSLKKDFLINTRLRNSRFVRECRVPDYAINNKMKGETSKNWKLFPYLVDILNARGVTQAVYEKLLETQGHQTGAIKGWVKIAREGKLAQTSCKKMKEYLERFHPDEIESICGNCPLYKQQNILRSIKENQNLSELQKEIMTHLALKDRDKATELIVNQIKSDNYIYTTKDDIKSEMWVYKDGIYIPQGKSFIKEFSRKILGETFTTQLANSIISKIEADTYIEHDAFFKSNYVYEVPVENGILNIITKELTPFNPQKIFFNKLPVEFNPSAECPTIIEHFNTVLKDEEDIPVLLELFGFLLLKEYKIEKAIMFVGSGRNGKSKTIELMKRFIGVDNCSSLPLRALNEDSFSLSELFGKMANLSADLSKTDLKETGMIKALIGRDLIQAKRKFLRDLNFVNYAKMIFACNELPKIYDTTDGFWTKWILIQFPYKFITQEQYNLLPQEEKWKHKIINPDIIEELTTPEELSGLLNLALEHLENLLKNKDFDYSKSTAEVKEMWIRQSDSFTAFCYDNLEEGEGSITKNDLRKTFHKYCKKHKIAGASDKAIRITLESLFGISDTQVWNSGDRIWVGLQFKNLNKLEHNRDNTFFIL
jgi:P4 family phage/plasmid primase-like protien